MDSVSVSAGGRLAKIYIDKERRRKITSMMNEIELKRLNSIKKQIADDKSTERHFWERRAKKIFQSNDDIKAFQKALLQRITTVKDNSKMGGGIRPLINLGRYGGASIEQIKIESEKFKPIRNPEQRRLIKTRILLEQGKRDGRIKTFQSDILGDVTESILNLEKVTKPRSSLHRAFTDIANLDDVDEADELMNNNEESSRVRSSRENVVIRRRHLVLPPLQVSRSMHPNMNYYRQISADNKKLRVHLSQNDAEKNVLHDIPEEHNKPDLEDKHEFIERKVNNNVREKSVTHERYQATGSRRKYYEWDYSKPLGPVTIGKYLSEAKRFWRPNESVVSKYNQKIVLPRIA